VKEMREYKHKITTIFVFLNDMVAVCDQKGEQMPFFQGKREEALPRIKRRLTRQKGVVEYKVDKYHPHFEPTGTYKVNYG